MAVEAEGESSAPGSKNTGDHKSEFELLFHQHYEPVLRFLTRLTANRGLAEEVANDVFWRLSRQPAAWLITANVAPWLYRTAMNAGIDVLRASGRRVRYERDRSQSRHSGPEGGPLEDLLRRDECRRVQTVLSHMKPQRAEMLLMRSCDWTQREIAEALGIAPSGVGTLLSRAEQEFRKFYQALQRKEKNK